MFRLRKESYLLTALCIVSVLLVSAIGCKVRKEKDKPRHSQFEWKIPSKQTPQPNVDVKKASEGQVPKAGAKNDPPSQNADKPSETASGGIETSLSTPKIATARDEHKLDKHMRRVDANRGSPAAQTEPAPVAK